MQSIVLALTAALSLASASPLETRQTETQSKPFNLVISSTNKTLDGTKLGACHAGAAIESLCFNGNDTFQFNTTSGQIPTKFGKSGTLTYALKGSNFVESEPMVFFVDPSTNVALPLFEPGNTPTQVGFDKKNHMFVQSYLNDEVTPPTAVTPRALYRWYMCQTNYAAYVYTTLAWTLGSKKPENPTCQKVEVVRKFV